MFVDLVTKDGNDLLVYRKLGTVRTIIEAVAFSCGFYWAENRIAQ